MNNESASELLNNMISNFDVMIKQHKQKKFKYSFVAYKKGIEVGRYKSAIQVVEILGVSKSAIAKYFDGKIKNAKSYTFEHEYTCEIGGPI